MPTPRLPKTSIRLATSASFFVLREDAISLATFFAAIFQPREEITSIQREMKQVFGLLSFREDQNRGTTPRWEIDSNLRGEPLEVLVSPVTRTFNIKRAVLYKDDLLKVLGYDEEFKQSGAFDTSILSQRASKPFIFVKSERAPEGSGAATIVTFYRGCSIGQLTKSYDVSGDLAVFENATIMFAGRQQFTT